MSYRGRYQPDYCKDRVWIRTTDLGKRLRDEFFGDWKGERVYKNLSWYIENSLLDRGEKTTRFLLKRLRQMSQKGRSPKDLAFWAIRQHIGVWMKSGDYDRLKRRPTSLSWEEWDEAFGEPSSPPGSA